MSLVVSLSFIKQKSSYYVFFRNLCTEQNSKNSKRTGMSVSQVTDEVLYTGLIEMHKLEELDERGGRGNTEDPPFNT